MDNMKHEAVKQAIFSVPSVWASTLTMVLGVTLNEWVGIASIVYCTLQSIYLVWRWIKDIKEKQ